MSYRPKQVRGSSRDRQDHVRSGESREEKIFYRFRIDLLGRHFGQEWGFFLLPFFRTIKKNIHKLELYMFQERPGTTAIAARLMLVRWKVLDQLVAVVGPCWITSPNFERVPNSFWTARHRVHLREARHHEDWLSHQWTRIFTDQLALHQEWRRKSTML